MAKHSEEYKEIRDGAITYFENKNRDNVIEEFKKSRDNNIRIKVTMLTEQKSEHEEAFLNSMEEFDALKEKIEARANKESSKNVEIATEEVENSNGDKEILVQTVEDEGTNEDGNVEEEKDISTQIDELEEKAKAMEETGKLLEGDFNSVNSLKNSLMSECIDSGVLLDAGADYERAQDEMSMITAKYMIEKNILVAKREAVILDINRAINAEEDVQGLQYTLIELNNQINGLDQEFQTVFPTLQANVSNSYKNLQDTTKEVIKKVEADFKNSYKQVSRYSEEGVLQSETTDLNKNLNRVVLNTAYSENVLADGKKNSISAQTVNVNGQTVRIVTTEHSGGVDNSFLDGNVELLKTGAGDTEFNTRDSNGSIIADNPELEDALKRIGIEDVEDIQEACDAIDEKAETKEKDEVDNEYEYQNPSLYTED